MKGIPDWPHPHLKRLESNFSHVEMGSLKQQVSTMQNIFGPLQVKGTCELDGISCKGYMYTLNFISMCFPCQHCWWVSYSPYPSFDVSSFRYPIGWPSGLSIAHCVHPTFE
jgi:hypothetical protein